MKSHKFTIAALGAMAFAVPALAADDTTTAVPTAQQQCRELRSAIGSTTFVDTYGTKKNAFGKCVSSRDKATETATEEAHSNAAKQCKADRTADAAAFTAAWGDKPNAYGKCVSTRAKTQAKAEVADELEATEDAAKSCKADRKADPAGFKAKYGTNKNKSNAFGRCVSAQAKAQQDDAPEQS